MKTNKTKYLTPKVNVVSFKVEDGFTSPIETSSVQASSYDVWDGSYEGNTTESYNDWTNL